MPYTVKEIFYSLQGEGANVGRPAVFCRFSGCNLWSGKHEDRASAVCQFCDTDFVGGTKYDSAWELGQAVAKVWTGLAERPLVGGRGKPFVVFTGGEPLLQLDSDLCDACHYWNFEVAVETNGTKTLPYGVDWITVSPKAGTKLVLTRGDELKLVYPQEGLDPENVQHYSFGRFYLQPMSGPGWPHPDEGGTERNTKLAVEYCLKHPLWRLSQQTHKLLGLR